MNGMSEILKQAETKYGFVVTLKKIKGRFTTEWEKFNERFEVCINDKVIIDTYDEYDARQCYKNLLEI